MLKVIQIIDSLNVGGAEVLAVNIANALADRDIESHLCVTRKEGPLKASVHKNVDYVFLDRRRTLDFIAIVKLKKYVKNRQIDVIHAHSTSWFIVLCIKILYPKIKFIWHNHTGAHIHLKGIKLQLLRWYSGYINYIISVNKELHEWSKHVLSHKNGSFIKNFSKFVSVSRRTKLRGKSGNRIVCLAGYRPVKDHLNLLEAFASSVQENPEWSLHLIGKNYNDAYGKSISSFIRTHQLEDSVFEYGVCSDIQHILKQADIGVLSSKSEGLPVSLLEYGLANIAVLVTGVGECAQVVQHSNAVVESEDSVSFANKLSCLMSHQTLREEVAKDVHHRVLKEYSEEKVVKTIISIYKELC